MVISLVMLAIANTLAFQALGSSCLAQQAATQPSRRPTTWALNSIRSILLERQATMMEKCRLMVS
jgi:hypothetical protein